MPVIKPDPLNVAGTLSDAGEAVGNAWSDLDKGLANLFIQQGQHPAKPMAPPDPMAALRALAAVYAQQFVAPTQAPMQALTRRGQETLDVLKKDMTTPANAPGRSAKPLDIPLRAAKTAGDVVGAAFEPLAAGGEAMVGAPVEAATGGAVPKALVGDVMAMGELPELAALRAQRAAKAGEKVLEGAKATEGAARAPAGPLSHADVQSHVTNLTKGWKANMGVHVVPSIDHLPPEVAAAVKADGMADKAAAFVGPDGKTVYMLADRMGSRDKVSSVLFHETLGHMGLNAKYGEQLDGALGRIMEAHPGVKQDAERYLAEHPEAYAGDPNRHLRAVEEVLAAKSEQGVLDTTIKDHLTAMIKQFARHMGFDLQMTDKELAAILRSAQNKVTGGAGPKVGTSGNRYTYVGEKGWQNVDNAKAGSELFGMDRDMSPEVQMMHQGLPIAKELAAEGHDDEVIRRQTGWFRNPHDGKWRYEVSDETAKFKWPFDKIPTGNTMAPLNQILGHKVLEEIYPEEMKKATFTKREDPGGNENVQGWYAPDIKQVAITPKSTDPLSFALHENQHHIQDLEGWHRGGSPEDVISDLSDAQLENEAGKVALKLHTGIDDLRTSRDTLLAMQKDPNAEPFLNSLVAFAKAKEKNPTSPMTVLAKQKVEADLDKLTASLKAQGHDITSVVPHLDEMADEHMIKNGYDAERALRRAAMDAKSEHSRAEGDLSELTHYLGGNLSEAAQEKKTRELRRIIGGRDRGDRLNMYQRISGEIEARDTQARQKMTPQERRATKPYSSEKFDKADVITPKGAEKSASMGQKIAGVVKKATESKAEKQHRTLLETVPGYKTLAAHLTPTERANVRADSAKKLVNIFSKLPTADEMATVAWSGRAKRGWYKNSAKALVEVFGAHDADRFAALLAALSPQTSVESNTVNALKIWNAWIKAGRPSDKAAILDIMAKNVQGSGTEKSVLDAWRNNTFTALSEGDPRTFELSGPKVNSFSRNLRDHVHEVTNDAWMANYGGVDQDLFSKSGKVEGGKGLGYRAMSARARQAASVLSKRTGETWTPAEIQETVWSWAKTLYEARRGKGMTADTRAILAAGGLTHEAIGSTPDFEKLFIEGVYRKILEEGGYGDRLEAVERSVADRERVDGNARPRGDATSAEGAGIAPDVVGKHLDRAAGRLEKLYLKRAAEKRKTLIANAKAKGMSKEELDKRLAKLMAKDKGADDPKEAAAQ